MRRTGVLVSVVGVLLLLVGLLFRVVSPEPAGEDESARRAGQPEIRPLSGLGRASAAQMPKRLGGVFLSMDEAQLKTLRPQAERKPAADTEQHYVLDEALAGGGQALYLFSRATRLLDRVQLAQQLSDISALSARVESLQAEYGPVSGVWDCEASEGQVPTRRFSWLRGPVGIMDVVLLFGERVLTTLYIGSRDDLQSSLMRAGCSPTPPERFSKFPAVPVTK
jgi:hypothetical protein